ncbi:hypothetical protein CHS0354_035818 [Potamilus streckersoni]|uniref:Copper type II ascorbate-dependent monooxygenase N-terminal domain-containing protein n=1 Tax=Potamilus streckersoni TaxID=2493646 RepID=A0AAE0W447_9BIVA|nr:hypothetical protein CHS0354_035818 [Potamilus streckersoni]
MIQDFGVHVVCSEQKTIGRHFALRYAQLVPDDTKYHAIAFEPIIYNKDLVHHIILFGCSFHIEDLKPHPCGKLDNRCNTWLVQWSVGMEDRICAPPSGGMPFGKNIFSYLSIQVHWNNDGEELNITVPFTF